MANWNLPTISSGYLDFVTEMNDKFVDAGTINYGSPTNLPNHAMRFNRSINIFEEFDLTNWTAKVIGITGGGTGSNTASGARTALGLGSMATQNSNAVNITGGSISGINFDAGSITAGIVALARGGTGSSLSLGAQGTVLMSYGGVTQFVTGLAIAELNANQLVAGTVPTARLGANVVLTDKLNQFTGQNDFSGYTTFSSSGAYSPTVQSPLPIINFYDLSQPVNKRYARIGISGGGFFIQGGFNDDYTGGLDYLNIYSTGISVASGGGTITANGSLLTNINGSNIASGIVNPLRLGTGAPSSATYLRGDGVWSSIATGGDVSPIPSGLIAMFDSACPSGWTRYSQLDNRFPLGSGGSGTIGGTDTHDHSFDVDSAGAGSHSHSVSASGNGSGTGSGSGTTDQTSATLGISHAPGSTFVLATQGTHTHPFSVSVNVNTNVNVSGSTDGVGNHTHRVAGRVAGANHIPPYYTVVYCRKN